MPDGSNVAFVYDGSFFGMLCCAYLALEKKEMPAEIRCDTLTFFEQISVPTDDDKAQKLLRAIAKRIAPEAVDSVKLGYLSCLANKEMVVAAFLRAGFRYGAAVADMLSHPDVMPLIKAVRLVQRERAKFVQFIRFSDVGGALTTVIEPENNVLPLLGRHFVERFPSDNFLIYDATHRAALIYFNGKLSLNPLEDFEAPEADESERKYRALWRMFYDTIEIKQRHNERCRMNFMPKKYWKNMTEFMRD